MSEAETRFGVSPRLDKRVTYQPDVIVMEQGAEAIREPSTDGFTWTIDANAQGASDIEPGKIVFATGRVVGRVLKVARKGNNLDVTLGPVELTDVIQEAHIDYNGTIDPAKMIVYVAPPGYPGTFLDRDAPDPAAADTASVRRPSPSATIKAFTASRSGNLRPLHSGWADNRPTSPCAAMPFAPMQTVYADRPTGSRGAESCEGDAEYSEGEFLRVSTLANTGAAADIAAILLNGFQIVPDVSKGLGANINYPLTRGMKFVAHANLRLESPRFTFRLDISKGTLKTASVELSGVGGLDVGIEGGTSGLLTERIVAGRQRPGHRLWRKIHCWQMLFQLRLIRDGPHAIHSQCHAHRAIDIVTRAHEAAQLDGALERPHFDSVGFAKWHGDLDRRIAQGGGADRDESFDSLDFALAQ